MSNLPVSRAGAIELALVQGDLSKLSTEERISYYNRVCESVGLNPLTRPFEYIVLNGKLNLYAKKDATDQLRSIHKISIRITSREKIGDVYVVTAQARSGEREDESTGAVAIGKAQGDTLANLFMKAETKAKRRVTLSICGLGILDETEIESIPHAKPVEAKVQPVNLIESGENKTQSESRPTIGQSPPERQEGAARMLAHAQKKAGWTDEELKAAMTCEFRELAWEELNALIRKIGENPKRTLAPNQTGSASEAGA